MSLLNVTVLDLKLFKIRSMPEKNDGIFKFINQTELEKKKNMKTENFSVNKREKCFGK